MLPGRARFTLWKVADDNGSVMAAGLVRFLRASATGAPLECLERIPEMTPLSMANDVDDSWLIFCSFPEMTELRRSASGYLNACPASFFMGEVGGGSPVGATGVGVSDKLRAAPLDAGADAAGVSGIRPTLSWPSLSILGVTTRDNGV